MSEAESAGSPEPSYDPADLRARMAVCLTASELRELALGLGAPGVTADRSPTEAARLLVRHFELSGGLGSLIARLHELKPLVEWPEPIAPVEVRSPFAPPPPLEPLEAAAAALDAAPEVARSVGIEAAASEPSTSGAAFVGSAEELDGPIIQDPHAPPVAAPEPWISSGDGVVRPGRQVSEPPAPARGMDPKILLAVAGMTLLAAVFAFAAGRATSHPSPASAEATPAVAPSAGKPARPGGPAALAADALLRSLVDVARICEVPLSAAPTPELLRAAFDQCGPAPLQRQPTVGIPPASVPAEPTGTPDSQPRRPQSPSRAEKLPPGPADDGCLKGCQSEQSGCNTKCGPEPTDASKYGDYQACYSRCLTNASKCRLRCPTP